MRTLICNSHHQINGRLFRHGEEIPPNFLTADELNRLIDEKKVIEIDEGYRRSVYRLFPEFAGIKTDHQTGRVSDPELAEYEILP